MPEEPTRTLTSNRFQSAASVNSDSGKVTLLEKWHRASRQISKAPHCLRRNIYATQHTDADAVVLRLSYCLQRWHRRSQPLHFPERFDDVIYILPIAKKDGVIQPYAVAADSLSFGQLQPLIVLCCMPSAATGQHV